MRPTQLLQALLGMIGIVAAIPAVTYYATGPGASSLPPESQLLAGFALPFIALLFLAGHL